MLPKNTIGSKWTIDIKNQDLMKHINVMNKRKQNLLWAILNSLSLETRVQFAACTFIHVIQKIEMPANNVNAANIAGEYVGLQLYLKDGKEFNGQKLRKYHYNDQLIDVGYQTINEERRIIIQNNPAGTETVIAGSFNNQVSHQISFKDGQYHYAGPTEPSNAEGFFQIIFEMGFIMSFAGKTDDEVKGLVKLYEDEGLAPKMAVRILREHYYWKTKNNRQ